MTDGKARALDAFLVATARAGDTRALSRLAEHRGDRLMAYAVRLLGDREAARDVVQEAWIEIMRALPRLRDDHAFLPFALRIVSRRVAREISRRQRGRQLATAVADEAEISVEEAGPGASDAAKVRHAIRRLPPEQAATVALFYLEDMSVAEVATATDVPVGTVKTRLMHARRKLRDLLEGESHEQD